MIYKITHDKGQLTLEFEGNRVHLRSLEELPTYIRFLSHDSPMPDSPKTRREMILQALDTGDYMSINQILKKLGAGKDQQRNFSSTCLNLVERKILRRKKIKGIYFYSFSK